MRGRVMSAFSAALAACALAGCELAEVTVPAGDDLLVVESIVRALPSSPQRVLLHRTLDGRTVRGEPGASVTLVGADGREVRLDEVAAEACYSPGRLSDSVRLEASCYLTSAGADVGTGPGEALELRVLTRDGLRVRGRTTVPGAFEWRGLPDSVLSDDGRSGACRLPPDTPLPLLWTRASGAGAYVIDMKIHGLQAALAGQGIDEIPEPLKLLGVSVSEADTTIVAPTEIGAFDRFSLDSRLLAAIRDGFPAGVRVELTVAALDRNAVNAVRGGIFNPSGLVRISSVVGDGVGYFGSMVPRSLTVNVDDSVGLPACR